MTTPGNTAKIGKYDIVDTIGRGGMGVVYLAKDSYLDRLVAIKMMNIDVHESADILERFYREAKSTASLQHPNIVTVYDLGEHQGRPFLVMEYLEGNSLEVLLRNHHPMSLLEKLNIILQTCKGLGYAHQRGIIHRDIKPANIMILNDGSVKIVDFGIARLGDASLTRTGQIVGSLYYMPPEQIQDQGIDTRADIYSAGVVLFQLVTYALPFEGENTASTLTKIISDDPPPFHHFGISCPPELEAITLKALAKNRDQRYASAEALAMALAEVQRELKQQAIGEYLRRAQLLQQNDELVEAQECLGKVLKLDRQHTEAAKLLSLVQRRLQAQLSTDRIQQLKQQADEACKREDFDASLVFVSQAIDLDDNAELQKLKAEIEKAKSDADVVRMAFDRAEAAQRSGDLDRAKSAIDAAMSLRPHDTKIKTLWRAIARDLEERERQRRLESLLDEARKLMSARKFTSALYPLKEAQQLDPSAPQLRALLDRLASEHQQEKYRRELEQLNREVQQAIDRDDYKGASAKAGEALHKFPNDSGLRRLKELADAQMVLAAEREFVRNQIAIAEQAFDSGQTQRALVQVESALQKVPGNSRLESFRTMLRERLAKDRAEGDKAACLQQANEAIGLRNYADAIKILEGAQLRFVESRDVDELLSFVRDQQRKEERQAFVDDAVRNAQRLLAEQHFDEAVKGLEKAVEQVPNEDLEALLRQARSQLEHFRRDLRATMAKGRTLLAQGSAITASEFLRSRRHLYQRSPEFQDLLNEAQAAAFAAAPFGSSELDATRAFATDESVTNRADPTEQARPTETPPSPFSNAAPLLQIAEKPDRVDNVSGNGSLSPSSGRVTEHAEGASLSYEEHQSVVREWLREPFNWNLVKSAGLFIGLALLALAVWRFLPAIRQHPARATTTPVLHVKTIPEGATIRIDNEVRGTSDIRLSLKVGDHQLQASLPGYKDKVLTVSLKPGSQSDVILTLEPSPLMLRVLSPDLEKAEVWLDDNSIGQLEAGSFQLPELAAGHHVMRILVPHRSDQGATLTIDMTPGAFPNVAMETHQLQVIVITSNFGRIRVTSSTGPTNVTFDGAPAGRMADSGLEINSVNPGMHELVLGEGDTVRKMSFEMTEQPTLDAIAYSDRNVGSLLIITSEDNAEVFIDGHSYPRRTHNGRLLIPNLETKQHTIHVSKDGFIDPPGQRIKVAKGIEGKLEFVLEPKPRITPMATLTLINVPVGGNVLVDQAPIGIVQADGSLSNMQITPGNHVIEVRKDGYQSIPTARKFMTGSTVIIDGSETVLLTGVLKITFNFSALVTVSRGSHVAYVQGSGQPLYLEPGTYTITARGAGDVTPNSVKITAGETLAVELVRH